MKKLLVTSLVALSFASVAVLAADAPAPSKVSNVSLMGAASSSTPKEEGFYLYFPALQSGQTFNISPNPKNYENMGDKTAAYAVMLPAGTYYVTSEGKNACVFTVQTGYDTKNALVTHLTSVQQASGSNYSCTQTSWQGTRMVQVWVNQ